MQRIFRLQFSVLIFVIILFAFYAFASSETKTLALGGEGVGPISGWTVSNIQYRLGENSAKVSAIEFDLDKPAGVVKVNVSSSRVDFFPCINISGMHWVCDTRQQISLSEIDELRVVSVE